jgi:hypothetical protein
MAIMLRSFCALSTLALVVATSTRAAGKDTAPAVEQPGGPACSAAREPHGVAWFT